MPLIPVLTSLKQARSPWPARAAPVTFYVQVAQRMDTPRTLVYPLVVHVQGHAGSPPGETAATASSSLDPSSAGARYEGEVVYIYAFDIAYELKRLPGEARLLGQPLAEFWVGVGKRTPRQLSFHRPQMIRLPATERIGPCGPMRVERTVKLLPIGAVSISVRVPFAVDRIEGLVEYHDLEFTNGTLYEETRQLAEELRRELAPYCVRPFAQLADEEAYTVFWIRSPLRSSDGALVSSEVWLQGQRRSVASLLTQEPNAAHLSHQEATETTDRFLSYYEHDLVVVDWDAALVADDPRSFEEVLYVMELGNLQLAELEAYDRILDEALERAYRDLGRLRLRRRTEVLREIREIRIDFARFNDELSNITKFFGDWHLARVYENIGARFHLADWHRVVNDKLKTLDDLYQLLQHDQTNQWMLILETTIVLLFIIDLALLVWGSR